MAKAAETVLKIDGMHCAGCAANIEKGVSELTGVDDCRVNFATRSAVVVYETGEANEGAIITKIKELGFKASVGTPDIITANVREEQRARQHFMMSLLLSIPLILFHLWPMFSGSYLFSYNWDGLFQGFFATLILFISGRSILADALRQAKHFRANMNSLIGMGTLAAYGWSVYALTSGILKGKPELLFFDSAGMIITLILLGRFLEAKSRGKAGEAIRALIKLQPSQSIAVINGVEVEIEAAAARPGMILLVKPGERIPADGEVIEGAPIIDESMLTGESLPVEKSTGDKVWGGSLNGNSSFSLQVTASGEDSFLSQIIKLVADAQGKKAPVQKLADKVAGVFVPIVIGLAVLTLILWLIFAPASDILIRSVISVLIIACPCALGLATPTAILAGTGRAAREGIIIRGGDILQELTTVNAVLFDKTGTLTHGELEVVAVKSFGQISESSLVRLAGSVEARSEHPIAAAIARYMETYDVDRVVVKNMEARPGFGVVAECDGRRLTIGSLSLMEAEKVRLGESKAEAEKEMAKGRTVVFVALDGDAVGLFAVSDRLRSEAKDVVAELTQNMQRVAMISGDNRQTVEGIARVAGLEHFEAEIKPDQKKLIVDSYRKAGFKVAMIGDGINDAPALATADIGVAMATGTDVAIEASDVVLVRSDLKTIPEMFKLAHLSLKIIKQNLFWAFFYNILAIPIAAGALYPWFGITLSPTIAAAAMAFSSVFVVTNSLRLNRIAIR